MRTLASVIVAMGLLSALAACAGRGSAPCEPVPTTVIIAAGTDVFRECAVERKASAVTSIRLDYRPISTAQRNFSVTLEFVIDSTGSVIASSIREVQQNDRGLADSFTAAVLKQRYRPATIGGRPVAQLKSLTQTLQLAPFVVRRAP